MHNYPETVTTVHNNAYASQKKPSRDAEKDTRTQKTGFSGSRAKPWHTAGWRFTDSKGVFAALPNGLFHLAEEAFPHHRKGSPAHPKRLFRTRKKCPPRSGSEKAANFPPHYAYIIYAQAFFRSGGISSSFPLFPPTHCNTSCINIHKEPPQQAARHLPTSAPARRGQTSADIRKA